MQPTEETSTLPRHEDDLRLLGRFRLRRRGVELELAPTEQRLVSLLALRGPLSRSAVAGRLWPDTADARAAAALRTVLWRLRRLAPGLVTGQADCLALDPCLLVDVDRLVVLAGSDLDVDAVGVPVGELLPSADDEPWVVEDRPRLLDLQVQVLERAGERWRARGDHCRALECAHAALRVDPLRESAHRLVVRVHLDQGNPVQALRWFDTYADLLDRELGLVPSPRMRELVDR